MFFSPQVFNKTSPRFSLFENEIRMHPHPVLFPVRGGGVFGQQFFRLRAMTKSQRTALAPFFFAPLRQKKQ